MQSAAAWVARGDAGGEEGGGRKIEKMRKRGRGGSAERSAEDEEEAELVWRRFRFRCGLHCVCDCVREREGVCMPVCVCVWVTVCCVGCDMFGVLSNCIICTFSSLPSAVKFTTRHTSIYCLTIVPNPLLQQCRARNGFVSWPVPGPLPPLSLPSLAWPALAPAFAWVMTGTADWMNTRCSPLFTTLIFLSPLPPYPQPCSACIPSTNFNNEFRPGLLPLPLIHLLHVVIVVIHPPRCHLTTNSREK